MYGHLLKAAQWCGSKIYNFQAKQRIEKKRKKMVPKFSTWKSKQFMWYRVRRPRDTWHIVIVLPKYYHQYHLSYRAVRVQPPPSSSELVTNLPPPSSTTTIHPPRVICVGSEEENKKQKYTYQSWWSIKRRCGTVIHWFCFCQKFGCPLFLFLLVFHDFTC